MSGLFTVICIAFFVAAVGFGVRRWAKGDSLLLLCLAGGLLAGLLEAMLDYMGLLWFADDNVAIAIEVFGRHIPLYVVLGYAFFFGFQAYIIYRAILGGRGRNFFIAAYVASWVFDAALQITGAQFGLYEYYGNQPFMIFGAPAWWFTIDASFDLVAGLVFYSLRHSLIGWGRLMVIPLIPMIYAGMNGALGWPVFIALNSNYDPAVNGNASDALSYLGGSGTILLGLFVVVLAVRQIVRLHAIPAPGGEDAVSLGSGDTVSVDTASRRR